MGFVTKAAAEQGVRTDHLVIQYLVRKTRAADRDSKSRRSLGNLYALYVLAEDFLAGRTSSSSELKARMQRLPFGSKLQNHPLDNRLNGDFKGRSGLDANLLPVRATNVGGQSSRTLSPELLSYGGADPQAVARVIVNVVTTYVRLITANQETVLEQIRALETLDALRELFAAAFAPNADARLFEVASYVLLAEHFRGQQVFIGPTADTVQPKALALYRTGRTNANDGGIDFVLQPLGRLFQVTETLDFKKYFLDFDKVNRYPISFVIKIEADKDSVMRRIRLDAEKSGQYGKERIELYMSLFEEIFTLEDLRRVAAGITAVSLQRIKSDLTLQFQLEYGLLD